MALGFTQPLPEDISVGKGQSVHKTDNLSTTYEPNV
jgi:hypothetical protein